jgi:integrase
MPRQKYQRPEVYTTGRREKLWKGEWREYYLDAEGKEQSRHKSKTWSRANYTKSEAQAELDALLREQQQGGPKRDGGMTLAAFWNEIYRPIRSRKWALNSRLAADTMWKLHIEPAFGTQPLREITKAAIELQLGKLADAGKGRGLIGGVLARLHSIFEEACDNDFVPKNPCRKIEVPPCKPPGGTRSLTEEEVRKLWDATTGKDYLMWRVMILTGARIGEALALDRSDLVSEGLRIDKSALNGQASYTKNKKSRVAPIPASLRAELEEWLAANKHNLLFPTPTGKMHRRDDDHMVDLRERAQATAKIPDLTFRMCRTTFATLFDGDIADVQASLGHHAAEFTLRHYRKSVTARHQAAVEELDRKLKVVPIKTGAA